MNEQVESLESLILRNFIYNEEFARRTLPYFKHEYFADTTDKIVFLEIVKFIEKYSALPTKETLIIEIDELTTLNENQYSSVVKKIIDIELIHTTVDNENLDWLLERSEKFCQDQALYKAITQSIAIFDGESKNNKMELHKNAIPEILSDALAVSFDQNIGHDFLEHATERFEFLHKKEKKLKFDLEYFNKITNGGIPLKTLSIILAGTNVGKTLAMCHFAGANLTDNKNVLYITLEMAEERIASRIDANLLNVAVNDIEDLPLDSFNNKINRLKQKTTGTLLIKEFPPASISAQNIKLLLKELAIKKQFTPDVIYIDYINLLISSRFKNNTTMGSYYIIKAIAEELRGLAIENNIPVISATQVNRSGFADSDFGLEDISEGFSLGMTADFVIALISSEELEELDQIKVKQLKNRYSDKSEIRSFVVGIDRPKMKLYDLDESAQSELYNRESGNSNNENSNNNMHQGKTINKDMTTNLHEYINPKSKNLSKLKI